MLKILINDVIDNMVCYMLIYYLIINWYEICDVIFFIVLVVKLTLN